MSVEDDGVGIQPEAMPRIFDPFYTTKRPGGGTGLGLSICMSIIREHGGNLDAKALPAGGSVFTVELPVLSLSGLEAAKSIPPLACNRRVCPRSAQHECAPRPPSVLVVDDEESIRSLLEEGLSAHQLHVDCAENAEAAIAFAENRSYDVLLADLIYCEAAARPAAGKLPTVFWRLRV